MTERTPGPWRIEYQPYPHIRSDHGCVMAADFLPEANAAFIVRACNSHDALVQAAQRVLDGLNARIDAAPRDAVPVFDGIADLSAALASAKEG